jgi:NCS1 family nucleobase:cation symporter-1
MDAVRRFENWAAPAVLVVFIALLAWILVKAGGPGPLLSAPSKLGWGSRFWPVFAPSLMAMIAYWSTLSLNIPDFTRFSRSQRGQLGGQVLGLPTTMTFFSLLAILITSGAAKIYHTTIWDPVQLGARLSNPAVVIIGLLTVLLATVSVNVAANVVSPSYDFSNLAPRVISFRVGGIITGVVGVLLQPWRLLSSANVYIFTWLGFYGGLIAAVAGVLVAGYWVLRRTRLSLVDLYRPGGRYWYQAGWNWTAVVATVVGALLADGGAWSAPGTGPFPAGGLIGFLKPLYNYSWVVGFAAGFLIFLLLAPVAPAARAPAQAAPAPVPGGGAGD